MYSFCHHMFLYSIDSEPIIQIQKILFEIVHEIW